MLMPDLGLDDLDMRDEQPVKMSKVITGEKFKFFYTYDFGDCWEHEVLVEKVLAAEAETDYPTCIKAKRACPPEDCGGSWGYQAFLEAIQEILSILSTSHYWNGSAAPLTQRMLNSTKSTCC